MIPTVAVFDRRDDSVLTSKTVKYRDVGYNACQLGVHVCADAWRWEDCFKYSILKGPF